MSTARHFVAPFPVLTLHITAPHDTIDPFTSTIEDFLAQHGIEKKTMFVLVLVLDEAVTNTISYGYAAGQQHDIHITLTLQGRQIVLLIEDTGRPFNPLDAPAPELDLPLAERKKPVGGMGVHLMQTCMETITYDRKNEKNILTLTLPLARVDS